MNKTILLLILISLFILIGGSYKPLMYKIFNDYEEECYQYRIDTIIEEKCCDWTTNGYCVSMFNETHKYKDDYWTCDEFAFWNRENKTRLNISNVCLEYHLVRKPTQ